MAFVSMPRQDLLEGIKSLAEEKNIDKEIVFESLEIAIAKIAKHKYGEEFNIKWRNSHTTVVPGYRIPGICG